MTRFEMEITGKLGEYWLNSAKKEVEEIKADYENGEITIKNGVAYNSIGRVVMSDMAEKLEYAGAPIDRDATAKARQEETNKFLANYRHETTDEEIAEMASAFGRGTKVVNIITGETITL